MSNNNEDDIATVVIDFNSLKKELASEEEIIDSDGDTQDELGLEFSTAAEENRLTRETFFFTMDSDYLKGLAAQESFKSFTALDEIKALNEILKTKKPINIIFHYNSNPKLINQILSQLNTKFTFVKSVLLANKLSQEKAQAHAKTQFAASSYLGIPFDSKELIESLKKFE